MAVEVTVLPTGVVWLTPENERNVIMADTSPDDPNVTTNVRVPVAAPASP